MKQTVYVVIDACSGEDYSTDEPNLLLVTTDYESARQFFEDEIENWRPEDDSNFEDDLMELTGGDLLYEATDFGYGDSHRILKLISYNIA